MLDRFTAAARQMIANAREIAEKLHHSDIGNEHLLRAIIDKREGLAWQIIANSYPPLFLMHDELNKLLVPLDTPQPKAIGFDTHVKKTIEKAFRHTESLKHKWIHTGSILLGILESGSWNSESLMKSWGFESEYLLDVLKALGDISSEDDRSKKLSGRELEYLDVSQCFSSDLERVLSHSQELARTYKNPFISIYHLLLSYAFLSYRKIVDINPFDPGRINLDRIKELAADHLASETKATSDMRIYTDEVCQVMRYATQEAIAAGEDEIRLRHLALGLMLVNPQLISEGLGISYFEMKQQVIGTIEAVTQPIPDIRQNTASRSMPVPHISVRRYNADPGSVITIPQKYAEEWGVLALSTKDNVLTVAMLDPDNRAVIEKIKELTGMDVAILRTDEKDLKAAFRMNY